MIAVRRYLVFPSLAGPYTRFTHQLPCFVPAHRITQCIQGPLHPSAAICMFRAFSNILYPPQHLFMLWVIRPIPQPLHILVIAIAAYTQNPTLQADWIGILMLGDERVFHFVSAAKNAVAFFKMSRSISSRLTWAFSFLISSRSAVSLPLPRNA